MPRDLVPADPGASAANNGFTEVGASGWKAGETIVEDLVFERELGRGGMGAVFLTTRLRDGARYAMKCATAAAQAAQQAMLLELQNWVALPSHPNLLKCHFVRTVGKTVMVFAEYVQGGSLRDWIDDGRLYRGSRREVLVRILDLAIQWTWGLHVVHDLGLVHQDVKPGNLLVSESCVAKVSDFGLARARAAAGEVDSSAGGKRPFESSIGMTPAYCSPEQADILALRQDGNPMGASPKLTSKTDIWSFGVSLFEMLYGEPPCRYGGHTAMEVFEAFLAADYRHPSVPEIPAPLVNVIKKCLHRDPRGRWTDCAELATSLKGIYVETSGSLYPRPLVKPPERKPITQSPHRVQAPWRSGVAMLNSVLLLVGRGAEVIREDPGGSERSLRQQAVSDLVAYDRAQALLARALPGGQARPCVDLATLYLHKARIYGFLDDHATMLALNRDAAELLEPLTCETQHGSRDYELSRSLATALTGSAEGLYRLGEFEQASRISARALEICDAFIRCDSSLESKELWMRVLLQHASLLHELRNHEAALNLLDRAIDTWNTLLSNTKSPLWVNGLAQAAATKAHVHLTRGDTSTGIGLLNQAIDYYGTFRDLTGHLDLAEGLARVCLQKASALYQTRDFAASLPLFDRALGLYGYIETKAPGSDQRKQIALACSGKAAALAGFGDRYHARHFNGRAIRELEALLADGRHDLAKELEKAKLLQRELG
jgi:serine/threonine protein kinase